MTGIIEYFDVFWGQDMQLMLSSYFRFFFSLHTKADKHLLHLSPFLQEFFDKSQPPLARLRHTLITFSLDTSKKRSAGLLPLFSNTRRRPNHNSCFTGRSSYSNTAAGLIELPVSHQTGQSINRRVDIIRIQYTVIDANVVDKAIE
jgi:hypothetical protein